MPSIDQETTAKKTNMTTDLALDHTRMAWIRTSLSIIAFGFTMYKVVQVIQEQSLVPILQPEAPRNVGLSLVGIGTFAVVVACVQHWNYVKKLKPENPYSPWNLAVLEAIFIGFLGLLILGSVIRNRGLFG